MNVVGTIGLLVAIAFLGYFAYKGLGALPLTILAGLIVIITNQMEVWPAYFDSYLTGYLGFFKNYFFIFASSSLFAKIMEDSGAAIAVGYKFIDWFGKDKATLVIFLATAALTYGGVSLFVVVFAMRPIIMVLYKEADLPRSLASGPLLAGSATFTMTALPGTPQLTNVIPSKMLGTPLTAAPAFSMFAAALLFIMCLFYLKAAEKKAVAKGLHFDYIPGTDASVYELDRSKLPASGPSFLPLLVVVGIIIFGKSLITDSTVLVVVSMLIGSLVAALLNRDRLSGIKTILNEGLGGAVSAVAGPCAVVGFGSLVKAAPAFQDIVAGLSGMQMHPYIMAVIATGVISGVTGSSSGGSQITLDIFAQQWMGSGANLEILHRLISVSAGSLDSLPHSSSLFLTFSYLGLTHKETYIHVFWTTVIIPSITTVILVATALLLGL